MDPRLLQYYNLELQHLREMGAEFAQQFPKIAARLGMNGLEVTDPYVERLLEGVGFLAARVHLKLDAEFPRFTQALLESIYPHYLAPTPSMLVAQCTPDTSDPNLATGFTMPRGSTMHGVMGAGDATSCEFRTAHDVRLWPVEIASASYFSYAPDLPLNALPVGQRIKGGVRIRIKATAGLTFAQTSIDRLTFFLGGRHDVANTLYELSLATGLGAMVLPADATSSRGTRPYDFLPASTIQPVGFSDDEALLPVTLRSFQGYRLLQEYFSFPQRFRFVEMTGLGPAISRLNVSELELVVLFGRGDSNLENVVDASNFSLFCTPAINLFSRRADRIHVNDSAYEYHVVPDRTRPLDFEVYEIADVAGYGTGSDSEQRFLPFYAAYSTDGAHQHSAYFTTRREPRLLSETQRRRGVRSSYIGSEVFLSLVDSAHAPFSGDLRQLSVQTLCTNRDLVLQMPVGIAKTDFTPDAAVPITRIRVVGGPSRPYAPLADGAVSWRAISHLSANYLSLVNTTSDEGAAALRDVLELYASSADVSARKQIDGIRSVKVEPIVRRLPPPPRETSSERERRRASMLAFGRGLDITVDVDEMAFEGGSAFLLGSVLAQYFSRYVSMNAFTQTTLRSLGRGEINQWVPQWGARPTL
jgi:type VI secretion system protein ImpG